MANFGGFLQALGQSFGGYAQDQQTQFARQQAAQKLAMEQQSANDAHLNALLERVTNYPFASAQGSGMPPVAPPMPGASGAPQGAPSMAQPGAAQSPPPSDGFPTGSVNVPGYGAVDPYGKYRMSLMMERLKRQQATDEDIRKAEATGEIGKNQSETQKNTREANAPRLGDANYADAMGEVESKKALATLPAQVRLEVLRGNISLGNALAEQNARFGNEMALQGNSQQFQQGQQGRQFQFDAEKASREMAGHFVNESALANQRAQGTIAGKLFAPPPMTLPPSGAVAPSAPTQPPSPRLTPQQVVRAARDPMYKQFLEAQGYTLTPNGARPGGTP